MMSICCIERDNALFPVCASERFRVCFNRYRYTGIYYSEYEITTFISLALFLPNTLDPGSERRTDLFSTYSIVDIDGRASQNYRGYLVPGIPMGTSFSSVR